MRASDAASTSVQQPLYLDVCGCPAAGTAHSNLDVCTDPECPEFDCDECFDYDKYCADCSEGPQELCEECSEHDAHCQACFDDCTSDCDLPYADCGEICGSKHDYVPTESQNELFGSHLSDTFDSGSSARFPSGFRPNMDGPILDVTEHSASAISTRERDSQKSPASATPSSSILAQPLSGLELLQAAGSAFINQPDSHSLFYDIDSSFSKAKVANGAAIDATGYFSNALSTNPAPQDTLLATRSTLSKTQLFALGGAGIRSDKTFPKNLPKRLLSCQWADDAGQPCGKLFHLADDLHDHLREVHNTKSSLFCRWLGCPVSALTAHPHRYANSVQRHTWGHSGYRPYKCSACGEGFAAANVRDEHFLNIHLKRKMFSCDLCNHQCTSATNLKRHKHEKHRAERFQCEFCNRNEKIRLFPRGPNLARHFRKCKYVLALFPEAKGAAEGKIEDTWYPPGYRKGHHGMDRAKITPPDYLSL